MTERLTTLPQDVAAIMSDGGRITLLSSNQAANERYTIKVGDIIHEFDAAAKVDPAAVGFELLDDPEFKRGVSFEMRGRGTCRIGHNLSPEWQLAESNTAFIEVPSKSQPFRIVHVVEGKPHLPVAGGAAYRVGGYFAAHRLSARLVVTFYARGGGVLSTIEEPILPDYAGGPALSGYQHIDLTAIAPDDAASAIYEISYEKAVQAQEKLCGYLFFAKPFFRYGSLDQIDRNCLLLVDKAAIARHISNGGLYAFRSPKIDSRAPESANIELRTQEASFLLVEEPARERLPIELSSNVIRVRLSEPDEFTLYIDGEPCAPGRAGPKPQLAEFIIPSDFLDGGLHLVEVRSKSRIHAVAADYLILPNLLTPWDVLQRHSTPPFPGHLAPAAASRFQGLRAHLGNAPADPDYRLWLLDRLPSLLEVLEQGFEKLGPMAPLRLPAHADPDVSVIIPVHNKANVTYFCLCALLVAHNKATFEVILVDDGSTDETDALPDLVQNLRYLRHEAPQGFVHACNRGAADARGKYVVFLNNDTEPTAGWLDELILAFETHGNVGLAGSRLLYPDGRQQEAGGIVWGSGNPWNYGRGANPSDPRFSYVRQADYVSGAALMLPRSVWESVGGFSDEYAPGYFEDTDLAFKVRAKGLKTLYVPHSVVYHFEGQSSGTETGTGMKRYQEVNRPKFKRRWAEAFRGHGRDGIAVDLEKDRGVKGRVLFIDQGTPRPEFDAGSYAAIQEMRLMMALGFKVTFAAENLAYLGHHTEDLQRLGIEVLYSPFFLSVEEILDRRGAEFDIVYIIRYQVALRYIDPVRRLAPRAKILFNNCDLHFLRELRAALRAKDRSAIEGSLQTRDAELSVMRKADLTLSYNEVEHSVILSHNLDSCKVVRAPWVVHPAQEVRSYSEREGIAFLGGFAHPPNLEAVEFFIESVMPLVRKSVPGLTLYVYGSQMPKHFSSLEREDVVIGGFVRDLGELYGRCRIFVAPLLSGAGLKGKVLSAMAYGVPCVLSPVAAEGIKAKAGYEYLLAETAEEWCEAITRLNSDEQLWSAISQKGQLLVRSDYSFEVGLKLMRAAFEEVGIY